MTTASDSMARSPLFNGFSEAQRQQLEAVMDIHTYPSGETVFEEGCSSDDIYVIKSGTVEVVKLAEKESHVISELSEGRYFGELSFLDGSPRSTAIRAKTDTELYFLNKRGILEQPDSVQLLNTLHKNIAINNSQKLRNATSEYALSLEKEVDLLKEKDYFNHFLITTFATYAITLVVTSMVYSFFQREDVYGQGFTWFFLAVLIGPFVFFVSRSGESWRFFGVTFHNWKQSLVEGLAISLGIMLIAYTLLVIAAWLGLIPQSPQTLPQIVWMIVTSPTTAVYLLHSYGQEFVARGVLQSSLQRAFDDHKGWRTVLLTSLIFGLSHIVYGPELVLVTIISGILFGFVFLRHRNLLGVSLVHCLLGGFAFTLSQLPFADEIG